jgi:hypothetical protein
MWRAVLKTVLDMRGGGMVGNYLSMWVILSFSIRILIYEFSHITAEKKGI